ncbi:hypothetical protein [Methylophaga sp. OBS1]|uniref:hypothetical protein n=1 Tax=Methylophaga sp. OBS1 TaxID=2991933 RepID=UPI00225342CA|nr:hypothetical protein [Methylophaga sp. OBS1]MCX4193371.1 hypothetical protein [Methylophaga sp. OBS1]
MDSKEYKKLVEVSRSSLAARFSLGRERACMVAGVNGPYYDLETPVRNSAHWLITAAVLSETESDDDLRADAEQLLNYLLDNPHLKNGVAIHRQKPGKDWCNGVIGQAWVIEALMVAGQVLKREDAVSQARQLAKAYAFSPTAKAWIKTDPADGKRRVDYTLNHQLWYAAAIAMLDDTALNAQIHTFLDALHSGAMRVRQSGVISHLLYSCSFKGWLLRLRYRLAELKSRRAVTTKEVGYHLYNLHPLARLKCHFPEHAIFQSPVMQSALDTAFSDEFLSQLEGNKYAYPYNAPGFEYPLIARVFQYQSAASSRAWDRQLGETFDDGVTGFSRNCPDPMTLNARVYEWFLTIFYDRYHRGEK